MRVEVVASTYLERPLAGVTPRELAIVHAAGKAAGAGPDERLIVAADTVVDLDGDALGKPVDGVAARAMLRRLSGRWHEVHTAFVLRNDARGVRTQDVVTTRVRFAELSEDTIAGYAAGGDGLDKAGGYGIQGFAATLVERIEGDYFAAVGFPLAAFARALPSVGYALAPAARPIAETLV